MTAARAAALLLAAAWLAGCSPAGREPEPGAATEDAAAVLAGINEGLAEYVDYNETAQWVQSNFITVDTQRIAARAQERLQKFLAGAVAKTEGFDPDELDPATARAFAKLRLWSAQPAPDDDAKRRELATIAGRLEGRYGTGRYCPGTGNTCYTLDELSATMAASRDYDENLEAWTGWRTVSPPMRDDYRRFVELMNEGSRGLGFDDTGELWRAGYDMSPAEFDAEAERLWNQVEPLYEQLHCYVRSRLGEHYGPERVPQDGPIPAHLLGNMWAQQWGEIYDLVEPYPGVAELDVDGALEAQGYTAERMVRTAEDFFVSLGLPALPDTFYERSLLERPADRDVVCHASAWPIDGGRDPRIKMCIEPTYDNLSTIYHELGHIYYYIAYVDQPPLFRDGAHDGFHEGIGDTVVLSLTPAFLALLGLVDEVADGDQALINTQMRMALDKLAFLPFGKMIDEWRWRVFSGDITPDGYNAAWWALREKYQGVAAPVARTEADFDPGAKYHIPANTPYTRYFLAHILQFQFQRALCEAAGHDGPLHECSLYGSKPAGEKLEAMLAAGASRPWQDTLAELGAERRMDASAVVEYFTPLLGWLEQQNEGRSCGW